MDLWQLNVFCKVVENRSFSAAGKAAHLSQPTVSSHVKDLEEHFGCRLVDRLATGAAPTRSGEILYKYARRLLALRDEAEAAIAQFHGRIQGRLMVGGSTIPGVYILPKAIGAFIGRYTEVTVSLVNGDTGQIVSRIADGLLEIGLVGAPAEDKRVAQEKLIEDELRLLVPEGHKWAGRKSVSPEMLLREPFISRETGSGTLESIRNSLAEKGFGLEDLNVVAEMGGTGAVIQGIKSRMGISIVSPLAAADDIASGALRALVVKGLDLKRHFYLSYHKYCSRSPLGQAFLEFLQNHCKGSDPGAPDFPKSASPRKSEP